MVALSAISAQFQKYDKDKSGSIEKKVYIYIYSHIYNHLYILLLILLIKL